MSSLFDNIQLESIAMKNRQNYQSATPFPHIVIDHFLPLKVAERILSEFPKIDAIPWNVKVGANFKKLTCNQLVHLSPFLCEVLLEFNSPQFLSFLEQVTGIQQLVADPEFAGGGLHQITRGGFLKIHADFNVHPTLKLDRRINVLLYLNQDWHEEYGGHLELWDKKMSRCIQKIAPLFNRCVIFNTTDFSYHGHPEPLMCPPDQTRKSIALYYYTAGRPEGEKSSPHSTLYQKRPKVTDYLGHILAKYFPSFYS